MDADMTGATTMLQEVLVNARNGAEAEHLPLELQPLATSRGIPIGRLNMVPTSWLRQKLDLDGAA
jgi:hypothetical protein